MLKRRAKATLALASGCKTQQAQRDAATQSPWVHVWHFEWGEDVYAPWQTEKKQRWHCLFCSYEHNSLTSSPFMFMNEPLTQEEAKTCLNLLCLTVHMEARTLKVWWRLCYVPTCYLRWKQVGTVFSLLPAYERISFGLLLSLDWICRLVLKVWFSLYIFCSKWQSHCLSEYNLHRIVSVV